MLDMLGCGRSPPPPGSSMIDLRPLEPRPSMPHINAVPLRTSTARSSMSLISPSMAVGGMGGPRMPPMARSSMSSRNFAVPSNFSLHHPRQMAPNVGPPGMLREIPDMMTSHAEHIDNQLFRQINEILNQLTAANFSNLVELLNMTITMEDQFARLIELIFNKAADERIAPIHTQLYAQLCHAMSNQLKLAPPENATENQAVRMRKVILNTCARMYEKFVAELRGRESLLKPDYEQQVHKVRRQLQQFDTRMKVTELNFLRFLAHLYLLEVVPEPVVESFLQWLFNQHKDVDSMDAFCHTLAMMGRSMEATSTGARKMDSYMDKMTDLANTLAERQPDALDVIHIFKSLRLNQWPLERLLPAPVDEDGYALVEVGAPEPHFGSGDARAHNSSRIRASVSQPTQQNAPQGTRGRAPVAGGATSTGPIIINGTTYFVNPFEFETPIDPSFADYIKGMGKKIATHEQQLKVPLKEQVSNIEQNRREDQKDEKSENEEKGKNKRGENDPGGK